MKPKILLCGAEISKDWTLRGLLEQKADLRVLPDAREFAASSRVNNYDLIILEFSEDWQSDLDLVQSLRISRPHATVLVVDGGAHRDAVIRSFKFGAKDYFKKPYDPFLLAERVEALLQRR